MNQAERVRKQPSNLITGIAAVGGPVETAASGRNGWTIPLKTRCLGGESRETNGSRDTLGAATGVQFVSVHNDRRESMSRLTLGEKNTALQNFGLWLTTPFRRDRL
jgi:hypothetical protein